MQANHVNRAPVIRCRETLIDDWLTVSTRPDPADVTHKMLILTNHSAQLRATVTYIMDAGIPITALGETKRSQRSVRDIAFTAHVDPYEQVPFLSGPFTDIVGKEISAGQPPRSYFQQHAAECDACTEEETRELKALLKQAAIDAGEPCRKWTPEMIAQWMFRQRCADPSMSLKFVDLAFPPTQLSLYRPSMDGHPITHPSANPIVFQRPDDVIRGTSKLRASLPPPTVFGEPPHDISPADVRQGILGDCYLCCALTSCGSKPALIRDLFSPHQDVDSGVHRVMLCRHGWWQSVILDEYLPTQSGSICFTRCDKRPTTLWPSVVEKAMAKCYGSYAAIRAGDSASAFFDITGCPYISLKPFFRSTSSLAGPPQSVVPHHSRSSFAALRRSSNRSGDSLDGADSMEDDLFEILKDAVGSSTNGVGVDDVCGSFLATLSTVSKSTDGLSGEAFSAVSEKYNEAGLTADHVYSLLRVVEIPSTVSPTKKRLRLVELRDPWGVSGREPKVWKGDFGPHDQRHWTPELQSMLRPQLAAEGGAKLQDSRFWLQWEDAYKWFRGGSLCRVLRHWPQVRIQTEILRDTGLVTSCLRFRTRSTAPSHEGDASAFNFYFGLHQKDRRCSSTKSMQYAAVLISVMAVDEADRGVVKNVVAQSDTAGTFLLQRDVFVEAELPPLSHPSMAYYVVIQCLASKLPEDRGAVQPAVISMMVNRPADVLDGDISILHVAPSRSAIPASSASSPYCPASKFVSTDYCLPAVDSGSPAAWQVRLTHPDGDGVLVACRTGNLVTPSKHLVHHLCPESVNGIRGSSGAVTHAASYHPAAGHIDPAAETRERRAASQYDPVTPTKSTVAVLPVTKGTFDLNVVIVDVVITASAQTLATLNGSALEGSLMMSEVATTPSLADACSASLLQTRWFPISTTTAVAVSVKGSNSGSGGGESYALRCVMCDAAKWKQRSRLPELHGVVHVRAADASVVLLTLSGHVDLRDVEDDVLTRRSGCVTTMHLFSLTEDGCSAEVHFGLSCA